MIRLAIQSGPLKGTRYSADVTITLGRDPTNSISIPDESLSRVHCRLHHEGGRVVLTDLGSTNGTFLNGSRIISAEVRAGDRVEIGESLIEVKAVEAAEVRALATIAEDDAGGADAGAAEPELSGNIFGTVTYYLRRKIASGGMGAIYEADQFGAEGFIKRVAIKTILPTFAERESFVASFVGEAKLVANLVHQNIVQIHHLGRHEGGYYIAMEYIDGVNLSDFRQQHRRLRRRMPVEIATFIVSRVARGLEYAHGKCDDDGRTLHLVHRDVSPNNIMITREGEVKLTDFGVAKARQFMECHDHYLVGSVEYMAPEQAACDAVDGRSDLYALGLVFYELLTGVRVFACRDGDVDATLRRVEEGVIPDPLQYRADLPPSLVEILLRCLCRDPAARYPTAGELSVALERELYARGYGPTIATLARYLRDLHATPAAAAGAERAAVTLRAPAEKHGHAK